jgi:RNA polymerase sigma-70 factor (ECF subfamily)
MKSVEPLMAVAEEFGERIEECSPEQLAAWEQEFRGCCAEAEMNVGRVCEVQADETLACGVAKSFCVNEAFVELFCRRYGGKLACWFVRHGRRYSRPVDSNLSDELTQELWFNVINGGLRNYNPDQSFAQYLFIASRNLFVSRVLRVRCLSALNEQHEALGEETVMAEVEGRETAERLQWALAELPPQERQVMALTIDGIGAQEIADRMGVTKTAMYQLRFHARRALEQKLGI